ncbi:ionotropic receptor 21a-like [Penaeus monodon]|uniref:ionotropic receptor 21a-like n=1 Tax=Penaeus monodon TaxID=6687 RepID=UPI0018A7C528|nr:ionotropic receptor 21a-like [Penaeus monodon]
MARTDPPAPRWKSLSLPFQLPTWLAMLVGLLIAGPVLFALAKASTNWTGGEVKILQTVSFSLLYVFGMHFREPQQLMPRSTTTRIFIMFLWLYTIILTTAYNSNLTAFLTVVQAPSSMETVKELHGSGAEVSGLGGFFKGALASAVDPYLQALAERFKAYNELNVVWPNVQSGDSVYLHNRQFLEFVITTQFTRKGVSSMRIMKECFAPYNIAMALQRNSPLKRKFDKAIRWMLESGLIRRWFLESLRLSRKAKEQKDAPEDTSAGGEAEQSPSSGVIPLSIDHMQGAFFVIVFGNVFALLVFLVESCCRKGARKEEEEKEKKEEKELGWSSRMSKKKKKEKMMMTAAHA